MTAARELFLLVGLIVAALIPVFVNELWAPGVDKYRFEPVAMGKGFVLTHGAITSAALNTLAIDPPASPGAHCTRLRLGLADPVGLGDLLDDGLTHFFTLTWG